MVQKKLSKKAFYGKELAINISSLELEVLVNRTNNRESIARESDHKLNYSFALTVI